jgi:hypothetical protein
MNFRNENRKQVCNQECVFALQAVQMQTGNVTALRQPRGFNIILMFGGFQNVFSKRFHFHIHKYSPTYAGTANKHYLINKTGLELEATAQGRSVVLGRQYCKAVQGGKSISPKSSGTGMAGTPVCQVRRTSQETAGPHKQPTQAAALETPASSRPGAIPRRILAIPEPLGLW